MTTSLIIVWLARSLPAADWIPAQTCHTSWIGLRQDRFRYHLSSIWWSLVELSWLVNRVWRCRYSEGSTAAPSLQHLDCLWFGCEWPGTRTWLRLLEGRSFCWRSNWWILSVLLRYRGIQRCLQRKDHQKAFWNMEEKFTKKLSSGQWWNPLWSRPLLGWPLSSFVYPERYVGYRSRLWASSASCFCHSQYCLGREWRFCYQ